MATALFLLPSSPTMNFHAAGGKSRAQPIIVARALFPLNPLANKTLPLFDHKGSKILSVYSTRNPQKPTRRCSYAAVGRRDLPPDAHPSPSNTIVEFYTAINDKNLKTMEELISEDCYLEDLTFPKPFQGRKEVLHFLQELVNSMGRNVKFVLESVSEGGQFTVGIMWHMEWKEKQIPFTRGCSFYECKLEERLVIKKGRTVVESPVKPGQFVLKLLKTITSLFDQHPNISEKFLLMSQAPLQWISKIYEILIRPLVWSIMFPIMAYYTNLWNLAVKIFNYISNILLKILKFFK